MDGYPALAVGDEYEMWSRAVPFWLLTDVNIRQVHAMCTQRMQRENEDDVQAAMLVL